MALGNTAAMLGDVLAIYNKIAGEEVFKNADTSSATPRAELTQNRIDAEEACIDIFRDYDEAEIKDKPTSVQICWKVGQALDIRARSE